MSVRPRTSGWSYLAALPWRVLNQRFSFVIFMTLALGLLVFGRVQPNLVENTRAHVIDGLAPVLDAISWPMNATQNGSHCASNPI